MKKFVIILMILILALSCVILSGCNNNKTDNTETCKITFLDWDGSIIHICEISVGRNPQLPLNLKRDDEGKTSYTFVGWDNEDTSEVETLTTITDVQADMTFRAVYKSSKVFSLYFMVDGEVLTSYKSGTIFAAPEPEKEGYVFEGWYKTEDFKTRVEVHYSRYRFLTEDQYLYAKFRKD